MKCLSTGVSKKNTHTGLENNLLVPSQHGRQGTFVIFLYNIKIDERVTVECIATINSKTFYHLLTNR